MLAKPSYSTILATMLYTLYLERRALIAAVVGFSLFGLFLFFAGYLLGSRSAVDKAVDEDADPAVVAAEQPRAEGEDGQPRAAPSFAVQIGAFATRDEALAFQQDQQQRGYQPFMTTIRSERQAKRLFSVRLGPFATSSEAVKAADRVRSDEQLGAFVVRLTSDPAQPESRRKDDETDPSK